MKTIIAATDFTEMGRNAVNYAADFSVAGGYNLTIVHIVSVPLAFSEVPDVAYNRSEMISNAEDAMNRLKEEMAQRTGNKIRIFSEVKEGDVVAEIESVCREVHPVLLVMGAESGNPFERLFMGTHTFSTVKQTKVPVLVIPHNKSFAPVRRIGLACDFHEVKETTPIDEIITWVRDFNAELHILHVSELKKEDFSMQLKSESEWLHSSLNQLHPSYHYIRQTDVIEALTEHTTRNKLDMLMMIARKHKGADKIFHRSHTRQIILRTMIPVLIFPEED